MHLFSPQGWASPVRGPFLVASEQSRCGKRLSVCGWLKCGRMKKASKCIDSSIKRRRGEPVEMRSMCKTYMCPILITARWSICLLSDRSLLNFCKRVRGGGVYCSPNVALEKGEIGLPCCFTGLPPPGPGKWYPQWLRWAISLDKIRQGRDSAALSPPDLYLGLGKGPFSLLVFAKNGEKHVL